MTRETKKHLRQLFASKKIWTKKDHRLSNALHASESLVIEGKADPSIILAEERNISFYYEILNTKDKRKLKGWIRYFYQCI